MLCVLMVFVGTIFFRLVIAAEATAPAPCADVSGDYGIKDSIEFPFSTIESFRPLSPFLNFYLIIGTNKP